MRLPAIALVLLAACGGSSKKSVTEPPMEDPAVDTPAVEEPPPFCGSVSRLIASWADDAAFPSILGPPGVGEGIFTTDLTIAEVPDGKCLIDDYDPVAMCQLVDGPKADSDQVYDEVALALTACLSDWTVQSTVQDFQRWMRADGLELMIRKEHDDAYESFGVYLYFGNLSEY